MISLQNVNFKYDKNLNILNNVTIDLDNNEKYAFIGENTYDGKSIFFRLLTGLEKRYTGEIFLNSQNIKTIDFSQDYSMGYIPHKIPFFYHKTVYQNLEYVFNVRGIFDGYDQKITNAITNFGLAEFKDTPIKKLTKAQKLMVALSRLSLRSIDCLLIENYVDELNEEELKTIQELIKKIFVINKDIIFLCDTNNQNFISELDLDVIRLTSGQIEKGARDNAG